jgi:small subunit ribosomal protein S1
VSDNDEDFAAMFEASIKATRLVPGQVVEGKIVAIGDDVAFVDVGSKGEATIALDELRDDDGALEVGVGDRVQATLVRRPPTRPGSARC